MELTRVGWVGTASWGDPSLVVELVEAIRFGLSTSRLDAVSGRAG
jgi:hypothetical protein